MSPRRAVCTAAAVVLLLLGRGAAAEPTRFLSGATCTTPAGSEVKLSPRSVVLTDSAWQALDVEVKRLQVEETRLGAENAELRKTSGGASFWANFAILSAAFAAGAATRLL